MTAGTPPRDFAGSCVWIHTGTATGTGYLVAPDLVATCHHVVDGIPEGGEVTLTFEPNRVVKGIVRHLDAERDAAVVKLAAPMDDVAVLALADEATLDASWRGYGYPGVGGGGGVPIRGIITRSAGFDDQRKPAIVLRCDELAAGSAAPAGGFSGTPVLVDGKVIGHLRRIIQDVGFAQGRPAFGVVWATPSRAIAEMLGGPVLATAAFTYADTVAAAAAARPLPAGMSYHVFVSYRSTDKRWAQALVDRLVGLGLRVFFAPLELKPGDLLMSKLGKALDESASAVVLLSKDWFASPWCEEESNFLLNRAATDKSFRVVPALLDSHPAEGLWRNRVAIDFTGTPAPEGDRLTSLLDGLGVQIADSTPADDARSKATDELFAEVRAARRLGPRETMEVWRRWNAAGLPSGAAGLRVAEALISQGRPQLALQVLDACGEDGTSLRESQLRALALAKHGKLEEAIELLEKLREAGAVDSETLGLLAGRLKQQWLRNRKARPRLLAAHEIYLEGFRLSNDPFCGINTAATALWLGRREEAIGYASQVANLLPAPRPGDDEQWDLATIAEAALIRGLMGEARASYEKSVALEPNGVEHIAVMRRGARLTLEALGLEAGALDDVFAIPRVVAFTGHMIDRANRPAPRFPADKEGAVRKAIRSRLEELDARYGFSSAADGGDILFLEELLKRDGRAQILLPFPADAFAETSVSERWRQRYDDLLADKRVDVDILLPEAPPPEGQPAAFDECNRQIITRAADFAGLLDLKPVLLAVWNGAAGDGAGGTADAVKYWNSAGNEVDAVDITKL